VQIERFLSIIAAISGFGGAMFILKGVLRLSPDLIAAISQTYWGVNRAQVKNLSSQRADVISGASLILLAFTNEILILFFIREPNQLFDHYGVGATVATEVSIIILAVFWGVSDQLSNCYESRAIFLLAKWRVERAIDNDPVRSTDLIGIEDTARSLLGMERLENERDREFLHRLAERLEIHLPDNLRLESERSGGQDQP